MHWLALEWTKHVSMHWMALRYVYTGRNPTRWIHLTQASRSDFYSNRERCSCSTKLLKSYHSFQSNSNGLRESLQHSLWGNRATCKTDGQGSCMSGNTRNVGNETSVYFYIYWSMRTHTLHELTRTYLRKKGIIHVVEVCVLEVKLRQVTCP